MHHSSQLVGATKPSIRYNYIPCIAEESDTRVPLILTAAPGTKTSLFLKWEDPFLIGNTTYEVVVTVGQEIMTWTTNASSWEVGLEGSDCQPFQVSVSMPGTCTPATLNGSLLLGEQNNLAIAIYTLFSPSMQCHRSSLS